MNPDPALTPELVQSQAFSSSFRGYEQSEVRKFLTRVAAELRAARERAEHLEAAWHSAEERAAHPLPMDEESLVSAVGEETAAVLRAARSAASGLRSRAEEEAARIVDEARVRADQLRAESEEVMGRAMKTAEEAAQRLSDKSKADVADLLARTKEEASAVKAASEQERRLLIEGAAATRERILDDLARRRRVATVQIEQLRVGRERLLDAYGVVRRTLEVAQDELTKADAEARAAADEVGRRAHAAPDDQADGPREIVAGADDTAPDVALDDSGPDDSGPDDSGPDDSGPDDSGPDDGAVGEDAPLGGPQLRVEPPAPPAPAEAPAEAPAVTGEAQGSPPGRALDALFARIRASQTTDDPTAYDPTTVDPMIVEQTTVAQTSVTGQPSTAPAETGAGGSNGAQTGTTVAGTILGEEPPATEEFAATERSSEDEQLLQKRESAVAELDAGLSRRLKRLLQDEHNDVLDRLRGSRGTLDANLLMPDATEQETRFVNVARVFAHQAAAAGVAFATELMDGEGRRAPNAPDVDDLVRDMASVAATDVRRRIEKAVAGCARGDHSAMAEAVGAVYREWKNQRVERLSGDLIVSAFSRGTWHRAAPGTPLRWIVHDLGGPCPDCDDDALAGALPKGEPFPTGQAHPPAHSGCRCLVVPSKV